MYYEVRDYFTEEQIFGTFTKYDDAIIFVNELLFNEKYDSNYFYIILILNEDDKNKLAKEFLREIKLLLKNDLKIVDINVIAGYYPNDIFIKMLIVDKLHTPMLLSYAVTINDELEIVDYKQISTKYLS